MSLPTLKVFVSSPGDVVPERQVAGRVLEQLAHEYSAIAHIEKVLWEHEPLLATEGFQTQIVRPSETDIVLCILWSRLGTKLPPDTTRPDGSRYASGTEFEFEDAYESFKTNGSPDLLVYRKTADPPAVDQTDRASARRVLDQADALDNFVDSWFHGEDGTLIAAFHPFDELGHFEELLETHLRKVIDERLNRLGIDVSHKTTVTAAVPTWIAGSPFRGLRVFEQQHAAIFFGRTQAIGQVIDGLNAQASAGVGFLLVLGMSGSGKSSLVQAGVLPLLTQPGVIEGVGLWRVALMRPGHAQGVFRSLAGALLQGLPELGSDGTSESELQRQLQDTPQGAWLLVKGALSQAAAAMHAADQATRQPEARLVLVLDQLEEVFTHDQISAEQRAAFFAAVSALAHSGRVWVIGTLRADFYHRCADVPELLTLKDGTGSYHLAAPSTAAVGQIIRRPAQAAGLQFEEEPQSGESLDEVLRDAVSHDRSTLPLLEFALEELYQQRTDAGVLTYAAYHQMGGVAGALASRADATFAALPETVQAALPMVFRKLVTIASSDSDQPTRRIASLASFGTEGASRELVEALVQARLLSADQSVEDASGGTTAVVSVAHEALLREWDRLNNWIDEDRQFLTWRSRLETRLQEYRREGPSALLRGKPLLEAQQYLELRPEDLESDERELISRSVSAARRRRYLLTGTVAVVMLSLVAGTSIAMREAKKARSALAKQQSAERERVLAEADSLRQATPAAATLILANLDFGSAEIQKALRTRLEDNRLTAQETNRIRLGLLKSDREQLEPIVAFVLSESGRRLKPEELLLIRGVLSPYGSELTSRCLPLLETTADRLRAGCLLAGFAADGDFWAAHADGLTADLVRVLPSELGPYRDTLRPAQEHLISPLATIYRDNTAGEQVRAFATDTLADYLNDDASRLFDLLADAQAKQFPVLFDKLTAHQQRAIELGNVEITKSIAEDADEAAREARAVRQANAAVLLLRMHAPDQVWSLLKHSPDPRVRSYLIHWLSPLGGDPATIIARYALEPDVTIRRALLLCLGEFDASRISDSQRQALIATLLDVYRSEPDASLHGAAEWLLRQWKQGDQLAAIDAALQQSEADLRSAADKTGQWYINGQGQTYVILEADTFQMGSPESEPDRYADEDQHRRRIGRRFAIASKEVTKAQWRAFSKGKKVWSADDTQLAAYILTDDSPMTAMTWYEAAWYCNWLSGQEGIPEDQWCYVPNKEDKYAAGMKAKDTFWELTGYRLPTEPEWEYACRAHSVTRRHYGASVPLLSKYGWYLTHSDRHTWPVARLKPNDFGLFDMHGNAFEWCYDESLAYAVDSDDAVADRPGTEEVSDSDRRVVRGGSFLLNASLLRSAYRNFYRPAYRDGPTGFRAARTYP